MEVHYTTSPLKDVSLAKLSTVFRWLLGFHRCSLWDSGSIIIRGLGKEASASTPSPAIKGLWCALSTISSYLGTRVLIISLPTSSILLSHYHDSVASEHSVQQASRRQQPRRQRQYRRGATSECQED